MTCASRFDNLHLLGEGAPPDAAFFASPQNESEKLKQQRSNILSLFRRNGPGMLQNAANSVMKGLYDSTGIGSNASGVAPERASCPITNLNMLEQIGSLEMNRIYTRSEKLNSEAIIDFVKALCKVSIQELQSASDPRVYSLTKIVEIA